MEEPEIKYKASGYCPSCNSIVETGILFSYAYDVNYIDELQYEGVGISLSKCLKCNQPFLTQEDFHHIEEHSVGSDAIQLYPFTDNIALKNAPEIVIRPYKEALKCYRAQAYEPCVMMCRKGIEAICVDKGENKGDLYSRLKKLRDKKNLEETFYTWANELRLIGNDGAHSHDIIITQQDAKDSLDFFDALITYLYHLVDNYNKLRARRTQS